MWYRPYKRDSAKSIANSVETGVGQSVDILYLVDRLENLIASSKRMPLVNQIILKEADILNIIDQLRTTIPDEIKQARRIIQDKERVIAQDQAEASVLLARAREETEQAVNREGLLRAAEARSQEIVQRAEMQAEQIKNDADAYVIETLRALRDHLSSVETDVGRSILSIEKGLASLEDPPLESDEHNNEDYEEEEQDPYVQPLPRRSSLAADTMGGPMPYQADATSRSDPQAQEAPSRPHARYDSRA